MTDPVMTLPRHPGDGGSNSAPDRPRRSREPLVLFGVSTAVYLVAGWLLIHFDIVFTDAISRVANAFYVLFSRDPHLPAMGFVWNPLPSFSLLPILPLKSVFPGLVVYGAAGAIQSALAMAGTVVVLSTCLRKLGVRRRARLVLVALFALQPMIVLYAGSGQSEPMLLLFLMLTASAMITWMQRREPGSLVAAGIALGFAYLTRYEAGAPAVAVTALVGGMTLFRSSGALGHRVRLAVNDIVLVAAPFLFAFFLWAASARILVGEWFPTFGSKYGNSAQVSSAAQWIEQATGSGVVEVSAYLARQITALGPLLAVLLVVTAVMAIRRRNPLPLVMIAVFGSVMAFCALVLLMGSSFGWLRFQITVIPLTVLLAGSIIGMLAPAADRTPTTDGRSVGRRGPVVVAITAVLVAVGLAIPVQAQVLVDPNLNLAREEAPMLSGLLFPDRAGSDPTRLQMFVTEHQIAAWFDQQDLGDGKVLADSAYAFPIIISSTSPRQFVISSDFDFQATVEDPRAGGVQYILVRSGARSDAVQVRWPTLFEDGAGLGTLVKTWDGIVGQWRLYAVQ